MVTASVGTLATTPIPFDVAIGAEVLDDLRSRLRRTRWPLDLGNEDWSYGANAEYLRDFCAYWSDEFEWSAQAAAINAHHHYRVTIGDLPIHYMHVRGADSPSLPILLLHGWPWTFWDFRQLVDRLTQPRDGLSFDVVVPSLPGFIFSTPLPRTGVRLWRDRRCATWPQVRRACAGAPHDRARATELLRR
jgi:hypothetical protein